MQEQRDTSRNRLIVSLILLIGFTLCNAPLCQCEEPPPYKASSSLDDPAMRYHFLACRNWNMGRRREAMKDFQAALKLSPEEFYIWSDRAQANFELAKYKRAWRDFEQAGKCNPSEGYSSVVRKWQGLILLRQGKTKKALAALNEAMPLWSKDAQTHYDRGVILQTEGDFNAAVLDYNQALELEAKQEHPNATLRTHSLFNNSICLKKIGRDAEADSALKSALKYQSSLKSRKKMFGAPGEPIKLDTSVETMLTNVNDER